MSSLDHAEVIVKTWLNLCKNQFTMENVHYQYNRNWGDIDILAVDVSGNCYDYEIKWSETPAINSTKSQSTQRIIGSMNRPERIAKIHSILNGNNSVRRVLIAPKVFFGNTQNTVQKHIDKITKSGIDVQFFDDVIIDLKKTANESTKDDSLVMRLLRCF